MRRKNNSVIYLQITIIIKITLKTTGNALQIKTVWHLPYFPTVFLEQRASHLRTEVVRDCSIHFNMNSTHPVFILHHATHPKQQSTAITTGIATSTVLATLRVVPVLVAGFKGGGAIVVDDCGTTWFRGVPDRKRYFSTESKLTNQHR